MLPILYLTEAANDLDAVFIEYEQRRAGLGDQFLAAVRQRVDAIRASPALYGEAYPSIRAAPLRRFPYIVYVPNRAEPPSDYRRPTRARRSDGMAVTVVTTNPCLSPLAPQFQRL